MKRVLYFFLTCFLLYIIYYDLTTGSLPVPSSVQTAVPAITDTTPSAPFEEIEIEPGDTLLSIIEHTEGSLPASIESIISDFENLNGIKPEEMQIGKIYKIPRYKNQ